MTSPRTASPAGITRRAILAIGSALLALTPVPAAKASTGDTANVNQSRLASREQIENYYSTRMNAFANTVGRGQAISVEHGSSDPKEPDLSGIVNWDGTLRLTTRTGDTPTSAYACPRPRTCYRKEGTSPWKRIPAREAQEQASRWTTQAAVLLLLPEAGNYAIEGDRFTFEGDAWGSPVLGSFAFQPDGYTVVLTYTSGETANGPVTSVTAVRRVPASKIDYPPVLH